MNVESVDVTYEEFLLDVKASIPISLFFCGNIQGSFDLTFRIGVLKVLKEWRQVVPD